MNFFPHQLPATQVTCVIYYYSTTTHVPWAMEWRSWPELQLQVTNVPLNPLVSGNGNADEHANQQTQLQGTLVTTVTTLGF